MRGRAAGHGVLRSKAPSIRHVLVLPRIHAASNPTGAPAARRRSSSMASARPVVSPSSAGHGLHPSFSNATLSPRARYLLGGAAPLAGVSAGHGVHPSFSSPAIVPAGTP
jgi:hypothetical protein